ncbi:MAG: tRNA preQ1(34) S-adenosylmethionine ribosyltransferase-isomerase QueA [Provencibacterium sp.]|jgi:S-adenosylmethionine:tRNA ribosyltransferase-isomerase|nr:tRNA preQ1(34) S-adenosylmethionine ribosyltransferase-isomerase QueA [Provencibacterium sp.]
MNTADFDYTLPEELIAQSPATPRDHSRMMCIDRRTGEIRHRHFYELLGELRPGDLLVANNSRVLPARLYGRRIREDESPGAAVEILLLEQKQRDCWEVLVRPGKKARDGAKLVFGDGLLRAEILETLEGGNRLARFFWEGDFYQVLEKIGQMPLPPYITQKLEDAERYQTVYSKELGSAAAPTAGLHFTPALMEKLREKGVKIAYVTLHVGLGTFRPVKVADVTQHKMHSEHFCLPAETVRLIEETKAAGGRVIAVGTTSTRTLETVYSREGRLVPCEGYTDIFIYPGFRFGVLDGLITNFHLPQSTLIMLVSAFLGYENTMRAYKTAVEERYRFYSFGDCMLIL